MKGFLLFVAGLLCGGAAVAWLFLSRDAAPVAVETVQTADDGTVAGRGRVDDDLALPTPTRDPHEAHGLEIDPLDETATPRPGVPPLQGADGADAAAGDIDHSARTTPDATGVTPADPAGDATAADGTPDADTDAPPLGEGRIVDAGPVTEKGDAKPADAAPSTSSASPQSPLPPDPDVLAKLRTTTLLLPVQGITTAELLDTYSDARGEGRSHDAIDIMAPTGRPVRAVADGRIAKLFASVPGGLTIYQFDADEQLAYYYAHLDRYADDLEEGATVRRGDVIGYVGATGNANKDAPHLHFAIFVLGPEKRWWQGTPVNPYPVLRRADTEAAGAP